MRLKVEVMKIICECGKTIRGSSRAHAEKNLEIHKKISKEHKKFEELKKKFKK